MAYHPQACEVIQESDLELDQLVNDLQLGGGMEMGKSERQNFQILSRVLYELILWRALYGCCMCTLRIPNFF
jgi:hypothetical protein